MHEPLLSSAIRADERLVEEVSDNMPAVGRTERGRLRSCPARIPIVIGSRLGMLSKTAQFIDSVPSRLMARATPIATRLRRSLGLTRVASDTEHPPRFSRPTVQN